ncbi:unnamed protein product [Calypogeia fissa]
MLIWATAIGADLPLRASEHPELRELDIGVGEGLEEEVLVHGKLLDERRSARVRGEGGIDAEEPPAAHHVTEILRVEDDVGQVVGDDGVGIAAGCRTLAPQYLCVKWVRQQCGVQRWV